MTFDGGAPGLHLFLRPNRGGGLNFFAGCILRVGALVHGDPRGGANVIFVASLHPQAAATLREVHVDGGTEERGFVQVHWHLTRGARQRAWPCLRGSPGRVVEERHGVDARELRFARAQEERLTLPRTHQR